MATILLYLGKVEVPEVLINISNHEQEVHFQKQVVVHAKKKGKKARDTAATEPVDATEQPGKCKPKKPQQDPDVKDAIEKYKQMKDNMAPPEKSSIHVTK